MIIDCISDLHGNYPILEGGDLLIVAGDLTAKDTTEEYMYFLQWCDRQEYKKIIFIAGNHDNHLFSGNRPMEGNAPFKEYKIEYLFDSGTEFEGLKIWGSPWVRFVKGMNPHCNAFTCDTEDELFDKFGLIPHHTDILITHSPPYGILDKVVEGYSVGSAALYNWLKYVERPKLHVFGHIHEAFGQVEIFPTYKDKMMISVNASHVNERYEPVNKPIRVIL